MLVLTRKATESLKIGDEIEVKVLSIRGKTVRIGVQAPFLLKVSRRELLLRNEKAAAEKPVKVAC